MTLSLALEHEVAVAVGATDQDVEFAVGDRGEGLGGAEQVVAVAALEPVAAGAAEQHVIAEIAEKRVVAVFAEDDVVASERVDDIVEGRVVDAVVTLGGKVSHVGSPDANGWTVLRSNGGPCAPLGQCRRRLGAALSSTRQAGRGRRGSTRQSVGDRPRQFDRRPATRSWLISDLPATQGSICRRGDVGPYIDVVILLLARRPEGAED